MIDLQARMKQHLDEYVGVLRMGGFPGKGFAYLQLPGTPNETTLPLIYNNQLSATAVYLGLAGIYVDLNATACITIVTVSAGVLPFDSEADPEGKVARFNAWMQEWITRPQPFNCLAASIEMIGAPAWYALYPIALGENNAVVLGPELQLQGEPPLTRYLRQFAESRKDDRTRAMEEFSATPGAGGGLVN